jgi:hypothetical protein
MALKYLNFESLSAKEKAELKKILNAKLKEIQGSLDQLDKSSGKGKKKAKKGKR